MATDTKRPYNKDVVEIVLHAPEFGTLEERQNAIVRHYGVEQWMGKKSADTYRTPDFSATLEDAIQKRDAHATLETKLLEGRTGSLGSTTETIPLISYLRVYGRASAKALYTAAAGMGYTLTCLLPGSVQERISAWEKKRADKHAKPFSVETRQGAALIVGTLGDAAVVGGTMYYLSSQSLLAGTVYGLVSAFGSLFLRGAALETAERKQKYPIYGPLVTSIPYQCVATPVRAVRYMVGKLPGEVKVLTDSMAKKVTELNTQARKEHAMRQQSKTLLMDTIETSGVAVDEPTNQERQE